MQTAVITDPSLQKLMIENSAKNFHDQLQFQAEQAKLERPYQIQKQADEHQEAMMRMYKDPAQVVGVLIFLIVSATYLLRSWAKAWERVELAKAARPADVYNETHNHYEADADDNG